MNGWKVQEKYKTDTGEWCVSENCGDGYYDEYAYNKDIETIITKEQYENNCYKVEE